jgi:hypothetical protein
MTGGTRARGGYSDEAQGPDDDGPWLTKEAALAAELDILLEDAKQIADAELNKTSGSVRRSIN